MSAPGTGAPSEWVPCPVCSGERRVLCHGSGEHPEMHTCKRCRGTGTAVEPSEQVRKRTRPLRATRRYWRHAPVVRWWFMYAAPERCMSCGRRWRAHDDDCYFA